MRNFIPLCMLIFLIVSCSSLLADDQIASLQQASDQRLIKDIEYLASEELKGRGVGTEGIDKAADFIAGRFSDLGLRTDFYDELPFQSFTVETGFEVGDPAKNSLKITRLTAPTIDFKLGESFNPLALGSSGSETAEVVFVGYGITSVQANFDEYRDVDTRGRVVIILRKEPRLGQPNHPLGRRSPTASAYFSTKVLNAVEHGAKAILFVNDRKSADELRNAQTEKDTEQPNHALMGVAMAGRGARGKKVPTMSVSRALVNQLLTESIGRSLPEIESALDDSFTPQSSYLPGVTVALSTDLKKVDVPAKNVISELPGAGSLAAQTVVVGAHYDHVGMGGIGSLAPGTVAVHNGADDNASGTAAIMEIARILSEDNSENRRRIVFIAFSGEERGLLGSKHYVRNPRFALEDTVAMINLDMVGRLKGNVLSIYGTGTGESFDPLLDQLNERFEFKLDKGASGYGPSDHQSFYEKKIPVLHFFTGLHNDYHRPSDDFDKINLTGLTRITDMVCEVVHKVAVDPSGPGYLSTGRGKGIRTQKSAYLGVQLQMLEDQLTITSVVSDSPAEKAGLQGGDQVLKLEDRQVADVESMLSELAKRSGGETLTLSIMRSGKPLSIKVVLSER